MATAALFFPLWNVGDWKFFSRCVAHYSAQQNQINVASHFKVNFLLS